MCELPNRLRLDFDSVLVLIFYSAKHTIDYIAWSVLGSIEHTIDKSKDHTTYNMKDKSTEYKMMQQRLFLHTSKHFSVE